MDLGVSRGLTQLNVGSGGGGELTNKRKRRRRGCPFYDTHAEAMVGWTLRLFADTKNRIDCSRLCSGRSEWQAHRPGLFVVDSFYVVNEKRKKKKRKHTKKKIGLHYIYFSSSVFEVVLLPSSLTAVIKLTLDAMHTNLLVTE